MSLHPEVNRALSRVRDPHARKKVRGWLDELEHDNRAITHAILSGIHRIPAPVIWPGIAILGFASAPVGVAAGFVVGAPTVLDWAIEHLAAHAAREKTLTHAQRQDVLEFFRYKHRRMLPS